ncbi:MAG TPA: hypothetical protein VLC07_00580 [Solirubrobacterales bacterium]|nr:hypothetical protein [Solirubrobacterales bacterium]
MIEVATVPDRDGSAPAHIHEVVDALVGLETEIERIGAGNGIDGRQVAGRLATRLPGWEMERPGSRQHLSWTGAAGPLLVDGQREEGRSILEIEGGGSLQNNRLHRDLLNAMLLDDVAELVLVLPQRVHGRHPFLYGKSFAHRLDEKGLLPQGLTVTILGYPVRFSPRNG